jgi:DNA-binding CsgD family transcriptional regulator
MLNNLTQQLTGGAGIPAALDIVRENFDASIVVLAVASRNGGSVLFANELSDAFAGKPTPHDRTTSLSAMMEQYQHITASERSSDNAAEYTIWIFRDREAQAFDNEEAALAGILTVQITRALELASRIDSDAMEKALYSDALDRLNVGVIIVDEHGRATSTSAVAERLLRAREGLQMHGGQLRALNASEDRELHGAIRAAARRTQDCEGPTACGLSLTKLSGMRTLGIVVRPVESATGAPLVAVFLRDCDAMQEVESDFVRQIFDLTPAEAAVTRRLTAGLSLEDAAASLDISRNTARAHLRSIFSKSGITRQTELVRLVLNSAVILGRQPQRA